jgi:hypothetical protein
MPAGPAEAGLLSVQQRRIALISEYPEVAREFELTALRHRVSVSGDTSFESPKSAPQRVICKGVVAEKITFRPVTPDSRVNLRWQIQSDRLGRGAERD